MQGGGQRAQQRQLLLHERLQSQPLQLPPLVLICAGLQSRLRLHGWPSLLPWLLLPSPVHLFHQPGRRRRPRRRNRGAHVLGLGVRSLRCSL